MVLLASLLTVVVYAVVEESGTSYTLTGSSAKNEGVESIGD